MHRHPHQNRCFRLVETINNGDDLSRWVQWNNVHLRLGAGWWILHLVHAYAGQKILSCAFPAKNSSLSRSQSKSLPQPLPLESGWNQNRRSPQKRVYAEKKDMAGTEYWKSMENDDIIKE